MSALIVASFKDPQCARAGAAMLRALHAECKLTIYGMAVLGRIGRDLVIIEPMALADSTAAPATAAAIGALMMLLSGSLSVASRTVPSGVVSAVHELAEAGLDADLLERVSRTLRPSGAAVIAEVEGDHHRDAEQGAAALGGRVFRQLILGTVAEQRLAEEIAALRSEMARLHDASSRATHLAEELATARKRRSEDLKRAMSNARALASGLRREGSAKVAVLRAQASRLEGGMRSEFERRASVVRAGLERRAAQLDRILDGVSYLGDDDN